MRYLYSNMRNRVVIKNLLTPRILQIFIDIGNYVRSLNAYKKIVIEFNKISVEDLIAMEVRFNQIFENEHNENIQMETFAISKLKHYTLARTIG